MGWYHYQIAENGTFGDDVNQVVPCPDGTCSVADHAPTPAAAAATEAAPAHAAAQPSTTITNEEELVYHETTPIYHLCLKERWVQAVTDEYNRPYFPPTFWPDGRFTRASCNNDDTLLETANHYYQNTTGEWLCLQLNPVTLRQYGLIIVTQTAPESSHISSTTTPIQCLKIYGGIPVKFSSDTDEDVVVMQIYRMLRDEQGRFYGMELDDTIPRQKATRSSSSLLQTEESLPKAETAPSSSSSSSSSSNNNNTKSSSTTTTTNNNKQNLKWMRWGK